MSSLLRLTLSALPVMAALMMPGSASAGGMFSYWGNPGYADTVYRPYYASYGPSYGPSYYGPSAGCCGASCGSCQSNYAGCGCDPCGCNSCGSGACGLGCNSCGGGCADGSCGGGNCNLNMAPAGNAPVPDPNLNRPTTPANSTPEPVRPGRRTFENDTPRYEPPSRNPAPMTDPMPAAPMTDPMTDAPLFPETGRPATRPPSRTAPPAATEPMEDGFRSRVPAPTTPLDDPGNVDPTSGFSAGKPELPAGTEGAVPALPTPAVPMDETTSPKAAPAAETTPAEANSVNLDGQMTSAPVVLKSRLVLNGDFAAPKVVRTQTRIRNEWSAAPVDARVVRN